MEPSNTVNVSVVLVKYQSEVDVNHVMYTSMQGLTVDAKYSQLGGSVAVKVTLFQCSELALYVPAIPSGCISVQ